MFNGKPLSPNMKIAHNVVAEHALRLGRKLTVAEELRNIEKFAGVEPGALTEMLLRRRRLCAGSTAGERAGGSAEPTGAADRS